MGNSQNVIGTIIISVAIVIVAFFARMQFSTYWQSQTQLAEKKLRIEAVDQCDKVASVKWISSKDNSEVTEPYQPAFDKCMKNKGY